MAVDIDRELHELRGVFPGATRGDFYRLDNGNFGTVVVYNTTGRFALGAFEVLVEFPHDFPGSAPRAWVLGGRVGSGTPHTYKSEGSDAHICYIKPANWRPSFTTYDVAMMVKSWLFAYCAWKHTGTWGWNEAPH